MAILKCKMCGGDLDIGNETTVVECEYCGTKQTVPNVDDEKKITLFGRANRLRFACEFDKAAGIYESIIADFPEEAEAYWGLVLCKYGIEYVDDPATAKKIPTCHRSSFDSVMDDSNFDLVLENADVVARSVYREEAKQIEELRKDIIEVSNKEEPYDIFICYKETADNGDRTVDSVIAQDVYTELVGKGYRVFFSRITLEDKLGQEYEPYIFAALNSAKIMLAFGTDYEYYNAVWVKNEWSRFLQLIASGEKKTLIPCYKDIDAYDMPKEFAKLQAQDMGKVGAIQDLLRGIEKLLPKETVKSETVVINASNANTAPLLKRAFMFLEDGDWNSADEYCEKVLDINPECAEAYLGKLMAEMRVKKQGLLKDQPNPFNNRNNYEKTIRFADENLKTEIQGYIDFIVNRNLTNAYNEAVSIMESATTEEEYKKAFAKFKELHDFKNSEELAQECLAKVEERQEEERRKTEASHKQRHLNVIRDRQIGISAGFDYTIGLKSDGTVVAVGGNDDGQCNVSGWTDIVAISAGSYTVGLKSDGTVVAVGVNIYGRCNVSGWTDIVAISAGSFHTVGLKSDGTVVAVGMNNDGQCNVSGWTDIVAISAGHYHTVGLKSNGTVVTVGENDAGQCNVSGWTDIVAISAGSYHTVALKSDGTVVAVGKNDAGQCNVSGWTDIVAISAGYHHTVGLKSDGTVVAVGENYDRQCNVSGWTDIVAISADHYHTVGLKSDGTVVAVGKNDAGQCNVSGWTDIAIPIKAETLEELQQKRQKRMEEAKRFRKEQMASYRNQNLCQHCGGTFKGLFIKKCSSCGKVKDY